MIMIMMMMLMMMMMIIIISDLKMDTPVATLPRS